MARSYTEAGAEVWIGDRDDDTAAVTTAKLGCHHTPLDVASVESWRALHDTATARSGPVDVLVNNAGASTATAHRRSSTPSSQRGTR